MRLQWNFKTLIFNDVLVIVFWNCYHYIIIKCRENSATTPLLLTLSQLVFTLFGMYLYMLWKTCVKHLHHLQATHHYISTFKT